MKSYRGFTLILLALFIQASSTENTTQSYYFELNIESSALSRFTELLNKINELNVGNATVTNIIITTECESNICNCTANYSWSADVCQKHPECCKKSCAAVLPGAMCLYTDRVLVNGSFTIQNEDLQDPNTTQVAEYTRTLTSVYSTLKWFNFLYITRLSQGSVIGQFVMQINGPFEIERLINTTQELQNKMKAIFTIITKGFIKIVIAPDQVGYHTSANITCTSPVTLDIVNWYIQTKDKKQSITNGTEATLSQYQNKSTIFLNNTSEVWKGTFTCEYKCAKYINIIHTASKYLDVALLPKILITSDPQFPNCKDKQKVSVKVKCIIQNNTEIYDVNWTAENYRMKTTDSQGNTITYSVEMTIDCTKVNPDYKVTCSFTNIRVNNTGNAALQIPVILATSVVCQSDGVWPEAMAFYNATLQCSSTEIGVKTRLCVNSSGTGSWEKEISQCVNADIWNLLSNAQNLQKGCGLVSDNANSLFGVLKTQTESQIINTYANINASVDVISTLQSASKIQNSLFNNSVLSDFVKSSSNLLNTSLIKTWNDSNLNVDFGLGIKYLNALEGVIQQTNKTMDNSHTTDNVNLTICDKSVKECLDTFNITFSDMTTGTVSQAKIKNLAFMLPTFKGSNLSEFLLSVSAVNAGRISMNFPIHRLPNREIYCVYFDNTKNQWSEDGCTWSGAPKSICVCDHLSTFASLMSPTDVKLLYLEEITYVGLGFSICSLVACLAIEFVVWNTVVKSNISHFRHTVLVNISLCLLIAHSSFLAGTAPNSALSQWCFTFTVMKHFCFLAVFFWMLCMSMGLLHQMIFVFVQLRKKVYLGLCFSLGYICPLFIVICTVINYGNGAVNLYYVNDTCWLVYQDTLKGSIYTFVIPVGIIVIVNIFTMVVVISRILKPTLSEGKSHDEKETVRSVIRTVVFLTPTLGITWIFGFLTLTLDLTMRPTADIVNYAFTFLNSFQGFFILLTGCFGEKKVRDALRMRIRSKDSAHYTSKSSLKMTAAVKKK